MNELLNWLRGQTGSVSVFSHFSEKALSLRAQEPEQAALLRLLADLADNFADAYFGEPLPLDVAEQALARLAGLVDKGARNSSAGLPQQMALLNEIGRIERL